MPFGVSWRAQFRLLDPAIIFLTVLLVLIGLAAIYSVTINVDQPDYGEVIRQLTFSLIGFALFFFGAFFDYRFFRSAAWLLYLGGLVLLVGVLLFGTEIRGAQGWFVIGSVTFQPVEIAKVLLIIFLSRFFAEYQDRPDHWRIIGISGLATALYVVPVIRQPDLGSAMLMLITWLVMLFFTKVRRSHLLWIIVGFAIISVFAWQFILKDYQKDRIVAFVNPAADPLGQGYNVSQSIVAIGSGKLFGRGLGLGTQSQLKFLPEAEEDFIFAVIAEELGFVGVVLLLSLYLLLFWRMYQVLRNSYDNFSFFLVLGILLMVFVQMGVNIGANIGLLPVAGVPLPLISAGGSSLIMILFSLGIVESVIVHRGSAPRPTNIRTRS